MNSEQRTDERPGEQQNLQAATGTVEAVAEANGEGVQPRCAWRDADNRSNRTAVTAAAATDNPIT